MELRSSSAMEALAADALSVSALSDGATIAFFDGASHTATTRRCARYFDHDRMRQPDHSVPPVPPLIEYSLTRLPASVRSTLRRDGRRQQLRVRRSSCDLPPPHFRRREDPVRHGAVRARGELRTRSLLHRGSRQYQHACPVAAYRHVRCRGHRGRAAEELDVGRRRVLNNTGALRRAVPIDLKCRVTATSSRFLSST